MVKKRAQIKRYMNIFFVVFCTELLSYMKFHFSYNFKMLNINSEDLVLVRGEISD